MVAVVAVIVVVAVFLLFDDVAVVNVHAGVVELVVVFAAVVVAVFVCCCCCCLFMLSLWNGCLLLSALVCYCLLWFGVCRALGLCVSFVVVCVVRSCSLAFAVCRFGFSGCLRSLLLFVCFVPRVVCESMLCFCLAVRLFVCGCLCIVLVDCLLGRVPICLRVCVFVCFCLACLRVCVSLWDCERVHVLLVPE